MDCAPAVVALGSAFTARHAHLVVAVVAVVVRAAAMRAVAQAARGLRPLAGAAHGLHPLAGAARAVRRSHTVVAVTDDGIPVLVSERRAQDTLGADKKR